MLAKAPKVALFAAALTLVVAWNIHRILKQERMEVRRKEAAAKAAAEAAAESASAEAESKPADDNDGDQGVHVSVFFTLPQKGVICELQTHN